MHPILSQLRILPWYLLAWAVAGAILAWVLVSTQGASWPAALGFALPIFLLYGFIVTSAYYVCRSLPLENRTATGVLLLFGGASLLSALIWLSLSLIFNSISLSMGIRGLGVVLSPQFITSLYILASLAYLVSLLSHDVLIAVENIRDADLKRTEAQVLARDAELQVLRSQINPHFLFNSLNSISALTAIDASAARAMVIELGSFFRKSLALSTSTYITLGEELALCEHYLAIEKIRFDERLDINISIEPESMQAKVPPMFLQPLVENAIKHGICDLSEGGTITIMSAVHETWLYVTISNPTTDQATAAVGTGTGLKNLKGRLQNLYGDRVRMTWQTNPTIFRVEIIIPFER